jgi:hypothetical protein
VIGSARRQKAAVACSSPISNANAQLCVPFSNMHNDALCCSCFVYMTYACFQLPCSVDMYRGETLFGYTITAVWAQAISVYIQLCGHKQ